jgi:hypothetical protein
VYSTFRVVEVVELEVGTEVGWELGLIPYNGSPVFLGRLGANMNKIKSLIRKQDSTDKRYTRMRFFWLRF